MRAARFLIVACVLGTGCLDGSSGAPPDSDESQNEWPILVIGGGELVLDCADSSDDEMHVLFECDSATIYSCKSLSNAVLEYESGKAQRFTGLHGQVATLAARGVHDGSRIASVWLPDGTRTVAGERAGGPRFEAPADSCGAPQPAYRTASETLPAR
jgi:hypothetical protein